MQLGVFTLLLVLNSITAEPSYSQQQSPAPNRKPAAERVAQEPVATFDTLLPADAYRVYGEVRSVGQLVHSAGVSDIIDPLLKVAAPPKQLTEMVKWLDSHADELMTSRMLVAVWPLKPKLPQVLIAIEFPSTEEAQKFVPQLREFLPQVWPSPTPQTDEKQKPPAQKEVTPAPPPFQIQRSGSIVLLSDSAITLRNLRPAGSKLLAEDANFRTARNRFSSESIFLYVGMVAEDTNPKVFASSEAPATSVAAEIAKAEDSGSTPAVPPPPVDLPSEVPPAEPQDQPPAPATPVAKSQEPTLDLRLGLLTKALFGGPPEWPEGIGLGLNFDGASYAVRVLLLNSLQTKVRAIPFIPNLISGPALAPEASSIMPLDTELFVTASIDFLQIYEGMMGAFSPDLPPEVMAQLVIPDNSESPFASFEKEFGISIEEELLPLLGNEVALSMPLRPPASLTPSPTGEDQTDKAKPAPPSGPNPLIAIAIKDREAVRALIAKMLASAGLKGAQLLAQTDRRDDSELISFANVFSYAFVGKFLVFSQNPAGTKHLVDSYRANQTLISDGSFKNYLRWQPRQVLGQVYIAPTALDYTSMPADLTGVMNEDFSELLSRLSPYKEPITYALSNEGMGPLHEIRFPKNFVMMFIAGFSTGLKDQPELLNEAYARSALEMIARAQTTYRANKGDGQYATLEQLITEGAVTKSMLQDFGYTITVNVSGAGFTVSAVPNEYGKTGKKSFFIDESGVLRGGDHGGGPATIADNPLN